MVAPIKYQQKSSYPPPSIHVTEKPTKNYKIQNFEPQNIGQANKPTCMHCEDMVSVPHGVKDEV